MLVFFHFLFFLLLFNYSCMPFLPIPPSHHSRVFDNQKENFSHLSGVMALQVVFVVVVILVLEHNFTNIYLVNGRNKIP